PGIDRPLFEAEEFARYIAEEVKVELDTPVTENGQKKIRGHIKSVEDKQITVICDGQEFTFNDDNIAKAKLVLTDNLIKNTRKAAANEV
ncbi:MAG: ribosome maturation factor RimP, partial [Pseudobdellovibrionaceae bacterium]